MIVKNLIRKWLLNLLAPIFTKLIADVRYEFVHTMLSDIGIEDFEKIIAQGKENRKTVGQTDYTNLTHMYLEIMRERLKK